MSANKEIFDIGGEVITKNIAWGVTGAGHYLSESIAAMKKVSKKNRVCIFVSRAGEEVLKMYGLLNELSMISGGDYLEEIFLESEEGISSPKTGRFMMGAFDLLIIAPATANTVAKIANGIADSIVTNAAALSNKAGIPVYVLPTEAKEGTYTRTPFIIDRMLCQHCQVCRPQERCPSRAISDQIDLLKCDGCGICVELWEHGAVRSRRLQIVRRELDKKNIEILKDLLGFTVLECAEEIVTLHNQGIDLLLDSGSADSYFSCAREISFGFTSRHLSFEHKRCFTPSISSNPL